VDELTGFRQPEQYRKLQATGVYSSASCPRDVPKSRSPAIAALLPSAGHHSVSQLEIIWRSFGTAFGKFLALQACTTFRGSKAVQLPRRRFLQLAGAAVALPSVSPVAFAQSYPSRPITLMVPFPPGGLTDVVGRLIAEGMRARLGGQTIIIENVGGATGSIGTGRVARAAPDGYTLTVGIWNTHVANGMSYALQYDIVNDFEPIVLLADAPLILLGKTALQANNLKELIDWLKANPDKASMGTTGAGAPSHLLGLLFQRETGTRFGLVPYRGANLTTQDLVAGQIDMTISNTATAMPHVRSGKVKAFAVTARDRLTIAPDIPSATDAGFPWFQFSLWAGLFAPKGTPPDIIAKLNAVAVDTVNDPATRKRFVDQGFVIPSREQQTPQALAAYQKAEIAKWWPVIESAGLKAKGS
jgi:tripartite-type tricarboxylate transporter receptor subunit TctC